MGYSQVGHVCKVTSIILSILTFIGSIVIGAIVTYTFVFWVFLVSWVGGTLFVCAPFYLVGEIIDQLERSNDHLYALRQLAEAEKK